VDQKRVLIALLIVAATWESVAGLGAFAESVPGDLVSELLDMPAPPPDWREQERRRNLALPENQRTREDGTPGDEAPIEVLLGFWSRAYSHGFLDDPKPSERVVERLLDACDTEPEYLPSLLPLLPHGPQTAERVKEIYDQVQAGSGMTSDWEKRVRRWVMLHSQYFRDDLVREARALKYDGYLVGQEALEALARLDPQKAHEVAQVLAVTEDLHVSAAGTVILFQHPIVVGDRERQKEHRERLKQIVLNREAPASARDHACSALLKTDWDGRDKWYLSLFCDETLATLSKGLSRYSPLSGPVNRDPDRWVPIIEKMVGDSNQAIHNSAVACLVHSTSAKPRPDVLRALLPWLADPQWATVETERLRPWLISSLRHVDVSESVPGLIWVVRHDAGSNLADAARALAHYGAKEAIPALRRAFSRETPQWHNRLTIVDALLSLGGFSDDELVAALEAYASQVAILGGEGAFREAAYGLRETTPFPEKMWLGWFVSGLSGHADERVAEKVLDRVSALWQQEPVKSRALLDSVANCPLGAVDRGLVRHIAEDRIGASAVRTAIKRREDLRRNVGDRLRIVAGKGGTAGGIAAVVLEDEAALSGMLDGTDGDAQRALLACARLVRIPLDVAEVGRLLASEDAAVSLAADRYLESEDSAAARLLLWARSGRRARILGAREDFDPREFQKSGIELAEDRLLDEMSRENAPDEIIALLSGYGGGYDGERIVRIRDGQADVAVYPGGGRYSYRTLSQEEQEHLLRFLEENEVDDLAPLTTDVFDGIHYEYVRLTKTRGRRVYMNNPDIAEGGGSVYYRLVRLFRKLPLRGELSVRYDVGDHVPGVKILLRSEKHVVRCVWKAGEDFRVLVEEDDELVWRAMADGTLGTRVSQPSACLIVGARDDIPSDFRAYEHLDNPPWKVTWREYRVRVRWGRGEDIGLWRCRKGQRPIKIAEGTYASPVVTPDGQWLVAAKAEKEGETWGVPKCVVRIELATRKEYRVDVPPARTFHPVAFVPAHGKVLLYRATAKAQNLIRLGKEGGEKPEYMLLDVATGETDPAEGEFSPLVQQSYRPLQPTGKPDEFWASVPAPDGNGTHVGRYDSEKFKFTLVRALPDISFSSMDMWIDEPRGMIYVVINGDLLAIPLVDAEKGSG